MFDKYPNVTRMLGRYPCIVTPVLSRGAVTVLDEAGQPISLTESTTYDRAEPTDVDPDQLEAAMKALGEAVERRLEFVTKTGLDPYTFRPKPPAWEPPARPDDHITLDDLQSILRRFADGLPAPDPISFTYPPNY